MSARRILELEERVCELSERVCELETQNEQLIALNAVMDDILKCFDGYTTNTQPVDRAAHRSANEGQVPCSVQATHSEERFLRGPR